MTRLPSSTLRGGSSRDAEVYHHFNYIQEAGKATKTAICLRCGIPRAENSTRQRAHLKLECPEYLSYMQTNGHMDSIVREIYALWSNSGALSKHIQQISSAQGKKVDLAFAKAAIVGMYPFSMYKRREIEAAFAKLGSYKPPSRKKVGGSLSDTLKQEVQQRVRNEILKPGDTINI
jgi:hypothetical protein